MKRFGSSFTGGGGEQYYVPFVLLIPRIDIYGRVNIVRVIERIPGYSVYVSTPAHCELAGLEN